MSEKHTLQEIAKIVAMKAKTANHERKIFRHTSVFTSTIDRADSKLRERKETIFPDRADYEHLSSLFSGLKKELELKKSTPKNKMWFKRSYVYCTTPSNCIPCEAIKSKVCKKCLTDTSPILTINYECCLPTLIQLFKTQAEAVYTSNPTANNGRFILRGYAGEGKSTWLNWLTSAGQEILWNEKLINIKIPASNSKLLTSFGSLVANIDIDKDIHIFQEAIWNIVNTKFMRIFLEHYYVQQTIHFTDHDFFNGLFSSNTFKVEEVCTNPHKIRNIKLKSNNKLAQYISITEISDKQNQNNMMTYKIVFHGGPMSPDVRDQYLSLYVLDDIWKDLIEDIYEQSKSTLSDGQISEIKGEVEKLRGELGDDVLKANWEDYTCSSIDKKLFSRDTFTGTNQAIVNSIASNLLKMGYRFLVIFDGLDPHHSHPHEAVDSLKFIRAVLLAMSNIGASTLKPAMLLAMRNETIGRLKLNQITPQSVAGCFQELRIGRVDIKSILGLRIGNVTRPMKSEYYKTLFSGSSDFSLDEFAGEYHIDRLCNRLKADKLVDSCNSIDDLNNILKQNDLYASIKSVVGGKLPSEQLRDLNKICINNNTEYNVKKLNRFALEEFYPQETPKGCFSGGLIYLIENYLSVVLTDNRYITKDEYSAIAKQLDVSEDDLSKNGFLILEYLLRRNYRHALAFCVQLLRAMFSKLVEKKIWTRPFDDQARTEKDALVDLTKALDFLKSRHYVLWGVLLARNHHVYIEYYKYSPQKGNHDEYWIDREQAFPPPGEADRAFGTIPNLFSFISVSKGEDSSIRYNKLGIRVRIMQFVGSRKPNAHLLVDQLARMYDIPRDETKWELDELLLMGLLTDADRNLDDDEPGSNNDHLALMADKELRVEPTPFWTIYKTILFSPHVLHHLLPSTYVPNEYFLFYDKYTNFSLSTPELSKPDSLAACYASRLIVLVTLLSYMAEHETDTIKRLTKWTGQNRQNQINFGNLTDHKSNFLNDLIIFKSHFQTIMNDIERFAGITSVPPEIRKKIVGILDAYLKDIT